MHGNKCRKKIFFKKQKIHYILKESAKCFKQNVSTFEHCVNVDTLEVFDNEIVSRVSKIEDCDLDKDAMEFDVEI